MYPPEKPTGAGLLEASIPIRNGPELVACAGEFSNFTTVTTVKLGEVAGAACGSSAAAVARMLTVGLGAAEEFDCEAAGELEARHSTGEG